MGSPEALAHVKDIVESMGGPVIVVVSALGGITDLLIKASHEAASSSDSHLGTLARIVARHHEVVEGIVPSEKRPAVYVSIAPLLSELENIYTGVSLIHDLSEHTLDTIVAYGERISSIIVASIISGADLYDSRLFIHTCRQFGKHVLDKERTEEDILSTFSDFSNSKKIAIVQGFIATDSKGDITNLGRGGSDYTAAILASALDASELEIWTDVDGFMTADPRAVKRAYVIDRLSFLEAMELCNYGAKVIYPPTIYPVFHKNIPIRIRNTFNPSAAGTFISRHSDTHENKAIKGISSISDTSLVCVSGLGMVGIIGINARIFKALANHGISVSFVSHTASESNSTFSVKSVDADLAVHVLSEEFAPELRMGEITDISARHGLSMIAVVGENTHNATGIAGKLFNTLARNGINVLAFVQGVSETNISCIISREDLKKALNVIHDSFFLSDTQVLHVWLAGVGTVGSRLLDQIRTQHSRLLQQKSLDIRVVGLSNSRHSIYSREGLDLESCLESLSASSDISNPDKILERITEMNLFNSVFVDCTSSPAIAALYPRLLDRHINVVAANKIAASGDYADYAALKRLARAKDVKFLFETNVGAGLPIINTINNLTNSGDKILKIEAVLSGTLNYIFNTLGPDTDLRQAIEKAQKAGYCESDPRIDLSGKDVVRKIVILAREAGYSVSQEDVDCSLFLPEDAFKGSISDFFEAVDHNAPAVEEMRANAASEGCELRVVAMLDHGHASVTLKKVKKGHPFYNLKGSNNVILLTTERYHDFPMEIKGYGAGAEVTAAGVFADIISIANVR